VRGRGAKVIPFVWLLGIQFFQWVRRLLGMGER
jgi:hypothetical protein